MTTLWPELEETSYVRMAPTLATMELVDLAREWLFWTAQVNYWSTERGYSDDLVKAKRMLLNIKTELALRLWRKSRNIHHGHCQKGVDCVRP